MHLKWNLALALLAVLCLQRGHGSKLDFNGVAGSEMGLHLAAHLAPGTPPKVQETAAMAVISRVIGARSSQLFQVQVNKRIAIRSFQVRKIDHGIIIFQKVLF